MKHSLVFSLLALLASEQAWGYQACVESSAALLQALTASSGDIGDDDIRIVQGNYVLSDDLSFSPQTVQGSGHLRLSGGWDADCATAAMGAHSTGLQGQAGVSVILKPSAGLTLSDLQFVDVLDGVHLDIEQDNDTPLAVAIRVNRVAVFTDAWVSDALTAYAPGASEVRMENLLIEAVAGCSLGIAGYTSSSTLTVSSSTLIARDNPNDGIQAGIAACFLGGEHVASVVAVNSVFQSDGPDIWIEEEPLLLNSSSYHDICPCGLPDPLHPASSDNLILDADVSGPPGIPSRFERLAMGALQESTLADSGIQQAQTSLTDVVGNPRVQGTAIDRGAFERAVAFSIFQNGFEQLEPPSN